VSAYNRSQAGIVGRRASLELHPTLNRVGASEFRCQVQANKATRSAINHTGKMDPLDGWNVRVVGSLTKPAA
jgi:hypothetical protein